MTEQRFILGKKWIAEGTIVEILDDEKVIICCFDNSLCDENPIDLVNLLNEQHETILMWCKSSKKITELLKEAVKPTYKDNVYLSIDCETKRCKYENTIICNQCDYYSTYFLDCRLMMGDNQYRKAISIGLI